VGDASILTDCLHNVGQIPVNTWVPFAQGYIWYRHHHKYIQSIHEVIVQVKAY